MILDDLPTLTGIAALWSYVTIPALAVIWTTALFGLNDVRAQPMANVCTPAGLAEFGLGLAFFLVFVFSALMLIACALGAQLYTWRGAALMWGIAGVFAFVGLFAPWRMWIRTLAVRRQIALLDRT